MNLLDIFALFVVLFHGGLETKWVKDMEGDEFEGDIVLKPEQKEALEKGVNPFRRGSIIGKRWPMPIPYVTNTSLTNSSQAVDAIRAAIADYERLTCLKFENITGKEDSITDNRGRIFFNYAWKKCNSPIGYDEGRRIIKLSTGCHSKGPVIHEVGHAIGLYHEQSRPDRDEYVEIIDANFNETHKHNFNKPENAIDSLGLPYDLLSVMHYGRTAFGIDGKTTIKTKDCRFSDVIGKSTELSKGDIRQINMMYNCQDKLNELDRLDAMEEQEPLSDKLVRRFWIQHRNSKKCFHVDNCYSLSMSYNCSTIFTYNETTKRIIHEQSGRCIREGKKGILYLAEACYTDHSVFDFRDDGFIQRVDTEECVHPKKGGRTPPVEGEKLIMWETCVEDRYKFELIPVPSTVRFNNMDGMCWKINENDKLIYSRDCSTKFLYTKDNYIMEASTKKCIYVSRRNELLMSGYCRGDRYVFIIDEDSLKNPITKKCLQPKSGGRTSPVEGVVVTIDDGCGESRLSHMFLPSMKNNIKVYQYATGSTCRAKMESKNFIKTAHLCAEECYPTSTVFYYGYEGSSVIRSYGARCICVVGTDRDWECRKSNNKRFAIYNIVDEEPSIVANGVTCSGDSINKGHVESVEKCAEQCRNEADVFTFGVKGHNCDDNDHCLCNCQTASTNYRCNGEMVEDEGYNLYALRAVNLRPHLVAKDSYCIGHGRIIIGEKENVDACGEACKGKATLFTYNTRRCRNGSCYCVCYTTTTHYRCNKLGKYPGIDLYALKAVYDRKAIKKKQ